MIDYSAAIPSTVTHYQAADTITLNVELGSHRTETPFIVSTLRRSLFPSHPVTETSGSHKQPRVVCPCIVTGYAHIWAQSPIYAHERIYAHICTTA